MASDGQMRELEYAVQQASIQKSVEEHVKQPVAVGFQCCSCCGQPGRKITTCSCRRQTGNKHQCLNLIREKQEEQKKERSQTRQWLYFSLALLQQPEQEKETEWEVVNIQAEIKVQRPQKNIWI